MVSTLSAYVGFLDSRWHNLRRVDTKFEFHRYAQRQVGRDRDAFCRIETTFEFHLPIQLQVGHDRDERGQQIAKYFATYEVWALLQKAQKTDQ